MTYSEMKDSGVAGMGAIPAHWKLTPIKYVASLDPPCQTSHISNDDEVSFAPMECIRNDRRIPRIASKSNDNGTYSKFMEGDIAIAKVTPCFENGNICIMQNLLNGFAFGSSELFSVRAHSIQNRFLFYCMQSPCFVDGGASTMTGVAGLKRVSSHYMRNAVISLPPEDEQASISSFLDSKCSMIDFIIGESKASIEEYKRWKASVIYQAVTKGLDPDAPMKDSGVSCIGTIPLAAKISRVNFHYEIILGKMLCPFPLDDSYTLEPYYCAANVHFEGIASDELKEMWFNEAEKERYLVKRGDLLVVEGGAGAGGCAIAGEPIRSAYIQNSIMIVRPKGTQDIRFLRYLIEMLVNRGYMEYVCNKATIPHFTKEKLGAVPYPLFNENDVVKISDYLDRKCAEIDAIISEKQALIAELEAYKKSLIYEAVTGKRKVG